MKGKILFPMMWICVAAAVLMLPFLGAQSQSAIENGGTIEKDGTFSTNGDFNVGGQAFNAAGAVSVKDGQLFEGYNVKPAGQDGAFSIGNVKYRMQNEGGSFDVKDGAILRGDVQIVGGNGEETSIGNEKLAVVGDAKLAVRNGLVDNFEGKLAKPADFQGRIVSGDVKISRQSSSFDVNEGTVRVDGRDIALSGAMGISLARDSAGQQFLAGKIRQGMAIDGMGFSSFSDDASFSYGKPDRQSPFLLTTESANGISNSLGSYAGHYRMTGGGEAHLTGSLYLRNGIVYIEDGSAYYPGSGIQSRGVPVTVNGVSIERGTPQARILLAGSEQDVQSAGQNYIGIYPTGPAMRIDANADSSVRIGIPKVDGSGQKSLSGTALTLGGGSHAIIDVPISTDNLPGKVVVDVLEGSGSSFLNFGNIDFELKQGDEKIVYGPTSQNTGELRSFELKLPSGKTTVLEPEKGGILSGFFGPTNIEKDPRAVLQTTPPPATSSPSATDRQLAPATGTNPLNIRENLDKAKQGVKGKVEALDCALNPNKEGCRK